MKNWINIFFTTTTICAAWIPALADYQETPIHFNQMIDQNIQANLNVRMELIALMEGESTSSETQLVLEFISNEFEQPAPSSKQLLAKD